MCDAASYVDIATTFISESQSKGYQTWVCLAKFTFNTPDPIDFGSKFNECTKALNNAGFTGDQIFLAGHSLGGVMSQN